MPRLNDKVAISTGAASGIGLSTLQLFASEGAKVVATDISEDVLDPAVESVKAQGGEIIARTLDVSSPDSWQRVVADIAAPVGNSRHPHQ